MPNRIRILRTTKANTSDGIKDIILTDGQPFYNKSTNYLYIGNGLTNLSQLKSITAENATITNTDQGNNANVKFKIGTGEYSKVVNNVAHSTNADNATNVNITNKNTSDNAVINFQLGNGTEFKKTVNNVAQANNTSLVQNVDLASSSQASFGNDKYIIQRKKVLWSGDVTVSDTSVRINLTNDTIAVGDTLEVTWQNLSSYPTIGNKVERFTVTNLTGDSPIMQIVACDFYGNNYFYIGCSNIWAISTTALSFGYFKFFALEGTGSQGTTLKTRIAQSTQHYKVVEIAKII